MKMYILVILVSSIFSSCGNGIRDGKELGIIGKTENEIFATYGEPDYIKEIKVSNEISLYEYQSSLYDLLNGKTVTVKEMMYKKSLKNKSLSIWFIQEEKGWIVIDALEWSDDINL